MTTAIELIACNLDRNDEAPNIELAEKLCENMDKKGIREIADGFKADDQVVASDCIKVLYEIGYRKPELIAAYTDEFITALSGRNNRLVWGSMIALSCIAPVDQDVIYGRLPEIISAYQKGSVITVDNSISVFANLCKANGAYRERIFPILIEHLENCRAKEIPQHAERIAVCIDPGNGEEFIGALEARIDELTDTQKTRVMKLIKKLS